MIRSIPSCSLIVIKRPVIKIHRSSPRCTRRTRAATRRAAIASARFRPSFGSRDAASRCLSGRHSTWASTACRRRRRCSSDRRRSTGRRCLPTSSSRTVQTRTRLPPRDVGVVRVRGRRQRPDRQVQSGPRLLRLPRVAHVRVAAVDITCTTYVRIHSVQKSSSVWLYGVRVRCISPERNSKRRRF